MPGCDGVGVVVEGLGCWDGDADGVGGAIRGGAGSAAAFEGIESGADLLEA